MTIAKPGKMFFKGLVIAAAVLLLDQVTKWLIVEHLFRPEEYIAAMPFLNWLFQKGAMIGFATVKVTYILNFAMVWNDGVSFGMLQNLGDYAPLALSLFAGIITLGLAVWLYRTDEAMPGIGLALIIAGSIGNISDRVRFGAVIDFIDFHIFDYHWPAFNIADAAICIGVGLIVIETLLYKRDNSDVKRI